MYGKLVRVLYDVHMVFQAIFCLLLPIGLAVGGAYLFVRYLSVGEWIYALLISLGVLAGLWSMVRFLLKTAAQVRALEAARAREKKATPTIVKNAENEAADGEARPGDTK